MSGPQFNEPIEEKYTTWFNPLHVDQVVDIRVGDSPRPTRYRVPAGGTERIPSRYDSVVHRVHNGVIIGGQAPQLVNRSANHVLDPALDTEGVKKRQADAEAAQASLAAANAATAAATASAKAAEAEKNIRARQTRATTALPPDLSDKPEKKTET